MAAELFPVGWKRRGIALALLAGTAATAFAQMSYQRLKSFGDRAQSAAQPHAALVRGADGALYGTTLFGGSANAGTVFRINPDGSGYTLLHTFATAPDGSKPYSRLVQGADGSLYGTTVFGGSNNVGTVFKINTNGNGYAVLRHFSTNLFDGQNPHNALVIGGDNALYGTTTGGGTNRMGTLFRLNLDGTGYALLHTFAYNGSGSPSTDGAYPGELVPGGDGALYGTTQNSEFLGNPVSSGTLFSINTNGTGYALIKTFSWSSDGRSRHAGLIRGAGGGLYGTAFNGANGYGAVFKLDPNGSNYVVLHSFTTNISDGQNPDASLIEDPDGVLYGTTTKGGTNGFGTVFKINTNGTEFAVLYSFGASTSDGQWPSDILVRGGDGVLYGTTLFGGNNNEGTVFRLNPDGSDYAVLRSFNSFGGDGQVPQGQLVRGADRALYGTTANGGISGAGTVFKVNPGDSNYTVLHDFTGTGGDGQLPLGGLLQGADGAFYGTTSGGGANGGGTIYTVTADGSGYGVLYSFASSPDGSVPSGTLAQGADGALYGVTGAGGSNDVGTAFRIGTNGADYAVLHHFTTNGLDGWGPVGGLAFGNNGRLFGTTADGGSNGGGTVFKISADGNDYTILHNFSTNGIEGMTPYAGLTLGADGAFYGTTRHGGSTNMGTVFRINPDGSGYTVLRSFSYLTGEAQEPLGELVQDRSGVLYGASYYGGAYYTVTNDDDRGTVFQINTNGFDYAALQSFGRSAGDNGSLLSAGLTQGSDGSLYGTTESGGDLNAGTLFHLALGPPLILGQPQDQTLPAGADAVFNVTAVGGALDYRWFYDGTPLTNVPGGATLTLTGVARSDAGLYAVEVSNTVSGALSSNAALTIQGPPLQFSAPAFGPDGNFGFTAAYAGGGPIQPVDLAWFEARFSSNLINWETLSNSLTWSNGVLLLEDVMTNQPQRFYYILEH